MLSAEDINPFVDVITVIDDVLMDKECDDILQWKNNPNYVKNDGRIAEQYEGAQTQDYRMCNLYLDKRASGLIPEDSILNKIISKVMEFNNNNYKFDVEGILSPEWPTLMEYNVGGHYDWHVDVFYTEKIPHTAYRKLSMSVILDCPGIDYEGGELTFLGDTHEHSPKVNKGDIVLFPSYLPHKIKPITKGQRNSLVGWFHGPSFK